ncbi:hypothetical protein ULG90_20345 [Halopseudomonas pachastrellae]|nr:hypothetical protein ULG90_20345 [Halopseudomonas pachastrellae]
MRRPQRTTGLLSPILLTALLALLASGCNAPSKHRDNVFAELNRRGISTDINGLKAATRSRQDDGAFLFADIGFFDTISDADLLEALIHAPTPAILAWPTSWHASTTRTARSSEATAKL